MKPIKILHLITELDIGGAQKALVRLLAGMDRERFEPIVACFYNGDRAIANEIRALGVPVIDLGMNAKWQVDALWRLGRLIQQTRPRILHSWLFHANVPGRLFGRLLGVPILISMRHSIHIGGSTRERLNRWTVQLSDKVITVCEIVRQAELKHTRASLDKVVTIYNGLDAAAFTTIGQTATAQVRAEFRIPLQVPLIGTIGRLQPPKDIPNLLCAMTHLKALHPSVRLLIVGDGALREELEEQVTRLNLSDRVIFAGFRSDVPEILGALDLFVLPSRWEGMPLVLLEAMAARLPIVATTVGGTPEVVVDDVTGLLVPPQDAKALAEAIASLLNDEERARAMGKAAYQRVVREFSIRGNVEQTERLYETLLREKLNLHYEAEKGWLSVG